jgi:hypothetical protein
MHLLLGAETDSCCRAVGAALESRGHTARIIADPFVSASRLSWRLDNGDSVSRLLLEEAEPFSDEDIEGALVRCVGWVEPEGWQPEDHAYMHAETNAALIGWLWSLPCPVVNRYPASIWYRGQSSLQMFQPLLWRCGLPTLESMVTNVESEARAFGKRLATGVVYAPLTTSERYLIAGESDWNGLAAMQQCAPVCLTQPHGATELACVVGDRVVWASAPPIEASRLEFSLIRFAAAAGLSFVEVTLAATLSGLRVIAVEPHPRFDLFGESAQREIVNGLTALLTEPKQNSRAKFARASARVGATSSLTRSGI